MPASFRTGDNGKTEAPRGEPVIAQAEIKIELQPLDMTPLAKSVGDFYKALVAEGVPHEVAGRVLVTWADGYFKGSAEVSRYTASLLSNLNMPPMGSK